MDKASVMRTVLLFLALINQVLVSLGKTPIPVTEADLDTLWTLGSTVVTIAVSVWTWWKNNYISKKGLRQANVLDLHNLK